MDIDWSVILGLTGGGGLFAFLPKLLDWLKARQNGGKALTESALKASGMSIESLVLVINKMEQMIEGFEARIVKQQDEYQEDFSALKKRYEEEILLLIQRHKARTDELLDEIKGLKSELAKYRAVAATVEIEAQK